MRPRTSSHESARNPRICAGSSRLPWSAIIKIRFAAETVKGYRKTDKYKLYGELLNTYGYELTGGEKELVCTNYYTGKEVKIPLDPQLTARENSQKYFDKYGKLKRTFEAQSQLIEETKQEIEHLESISTSLDIAF